MIAGRSRPWRIVITPYLNARAFVHHGAPAGAELVALPPREAVSVIARGAAVAGIVPVGALGEIAHEVELLGEYGIACPGPSQSVLLFSRVPFDALDERMCLRLSTESRSSVRLLQVLLAWRGGGMPRAAAAHEASDGELVIGDAALLRAATPDPARPYVVDLAERWQALTSLPMVFARWVVRRDAPGALRASLLAWLAAYARAEPTLLARAARLDGARAGLDAHRARDYLAGIRTVLGAAELRGQQRYLDALATAERRDVVATAMPMPCHGTSPVPRAPTAVHP